MTTRFLLTRYLYSFRRKPASSKFDWHFTAMHKSSKIIATITGSFLLCPIRAFSNCSCIDHLVSGPIYDFFFVLTSLLHSFSHISCKSIIQKVNHTFLWLLRCLRFLVLFHCASYASFQLSLTLLFLYRCIVIFSL